MSDEKEEKKPAFTTQNAEVAPIEEAQTKVAEDGTFIRPDRSKIYKQWFRASKEKGKEINNASRGKSVSVSSRALNGNISLNNHNAKKKKR